MRTLEVPIEIEVYEGCASATPVFPHRAGRTPRRTARRPAARAPLGAEIESTEALQFAGALPAEITIE
jgi:hypothetical protein